MSDGSPGLAWRTLKNSIYGVIEFAWPVLIGLVASPYIVRSLGVDAYGLLSVVGVTMGFFGFLDLGVGGAAIRQIATYHEQQDSVMVNKVVSTVLAFYLLVGAAGAVLILGATNVMVTRLLEIPPALLNAARLAFYISAPSFTISFVNGVFGSIPRAVQRYDLAAKASLALATLNTGVTVFLLSRGEGVLSVVIAGTLINILSLPLLYAIAKRLMPSLRVRPHFDGAMMKELFTFGGYFLLSQLGVLLLYQLDKLLIGSFLGVGAVTYYVVPGNLAQKIQGLVAAATSVAFPVSAALFASKDRAALHRLYREGFRLVFALVITIAVPLAVFAEPFLRFWMGERIAAQSATPMVLLVITYAVLSLSSIPWGIANGSGRAKVNALFTLAIAVLDVAAFLLLVRPYGVTGAAGAYLFSAVVGVPVLIWFIERHVLQLSGREFLLVVWRIGLVGLVQTAIAFAARTFAVNLLTCMALMAITALVFPILYWRMGLMQEGDKRLVSLLTRRFQG